jgi:hypothetical protein
MCLSLQQQRERKMKATDLKPGMKVTFTPTGKVFEIAKVTETRVSWYNGFAHKSSWGKNTIKMTWVTLKEFQRGIDSGAYIVVK